MKKIVGYIVSFVFGTMFAGGSVWAATNYVQAQEGQSTVTLNGQTVSNPSKLIYGGTTYVQLYSIQQALKRSSWEANWDGNTFAMTSPSSSSSSYNSWSTSYTYDSEIEFNLPVDANGDYVPVMFDSGATGCVIPQSLATVLDLPKLGTVTVNTGNGPVQDVQTMFSYRLGNRIVTDQHAIIVPDSSQSKPSLGFAQLEKEGISIVIDAQKNTLEFIWPKDPGTQFYSSK